VVSDPWKTWVAGQQDEAPPCGGGNLGLLDGGFGGLSLDMKFLRVLVLGFLGMGIGCGEEGGFDSVEGPNVRVTRHDDGSKTVFTRSPDNRTLTKRTYTATGKEYLLTIYRMDAHGNPTGCKIYDGQKNEMFKSSYGYRKSDGQLVEERMFDSRTKRIDPNTGKEMPVRRFLYTYDALGNRSAPISITLIPGATAEEVYGKATALDKNPFLEGEQ
jgi:hypothetical protein